ncbi:MAG: TetR/AcrR family transcriptional regulator C-terminal domain-containing protein [Erysipelotrichaceae bacterium]|nr:TetR/AcrR family transcriptional regulator C-terminal domain-containing protein [Erysipelotrichaceae bacterium]
MIGQVDTCYKIADSLKELMNKHPLNKITVQDIVSQCGYTRQTFYRYFKDKYDCVNWYFERLAERSFKQLGSGCNLEDGLIKKFKLMRKDQHFFYEAFMADDHNSLFQYDYQCIYEFYSHLIIEKSQQPLSKELDFLLKMYCKGSIDMTFDWVKTGMKMSEAELSRYLVSAMPEMLKPYLLYDTSISWKNSN